MGCCCSCLEGDDTSPADTCRRETELTSSATSSLAVSKQKSSPHIEIDKACTVHGYGLALVGAVLEQDAAYWEIHVDEATDAGIWVGVSTEKGPSFYSVLNEDDNKGDGDDKGTQYMSLIDVKTGDVIGVAAQQGDLPMLQFTLNGDMIFEKSINRFRGTVYPAVCLPEEGSATVSLVFGEDKFQQLSPGPRFGPFIVARGLI